MKKVSQLELDDILNKKNQAYEKGDFEASRLIFQDLNLSGLNFREFKTVKADLINIDRFSFSSHLLFLL